MMQDAGDNGFPIKTFGNDEKEISLFLRGKLKVTLFVPLFL
jgi:hypothetical protein